MTEAHRVAIYRSGGVGDTLLLTPALRAVRRMCAGAEVVFCGRCDVGELLRHWQLVDTIVSADTPDLSGLFRPGSGVEAAVRALGTPEAAIIYSSMGGDVVARESLTSALADSGAQGVLYDPHPPAGRHAAHHLLLGLTGLIDGVAWDGPAAVDPVANTGHEGRAAFDGHRGPIVLHPGAGAEWKRWPADRFLELATALAGQGEDVLVIAGSAEAGMVDGLRWPVPVARGLELPELAELLGRAKAFAGNDSGVAHLAGLLGVPTVALFGPTHPESWTPMGPRVTVVRHCGAPASDNVRVCWNPGCLLETTVEEVSRTILGLSHEPDPGRRHRAIRPFLLN